MNSLKPAHEVLVDAIQNHCRNLQEIEKMIAQRGSYNKISSSRVIPRWELDEGRIMEIGGLCTLLEALVIMIIPEDKLDEVIQSLRELDYRHVMIHNTAEQLFRRKRVEART